MSRCEPTRNLQRGGGLINALLHSAVRDPGVGGPLRPEPGRGLVAAVPRAGRRQRHRQLSAEARRLLAVARRPPQVAQVAVPPLPLGPRLDGAPAAPAQGPRRRALLRLQNGRILFPGKIASCFMRCEKQVHATKGKH